MTEIFAKPAAGAIIEKTENGCDYILLQERQKENAGTENGLLEIPAGKIREYENIFDALRREIWEETGLTVTDITEEKETVFEDLNGYRIISFSPFCSTQNLSGGYSIVLQTFTCRAEGVLLAKTNETANMRWVTHAECLKMLAENPAQFYPMHICALKKYFKLPVLPYALQ